MKNWKQRWFELFASQADGEGRGATLLYYTSTEIGTRARAAIPLQHCSVDVVQERSRANCFAVTIDRRHGHAHARYVLSADSAEETQQWRAMIERVARPEHNPRPALCGAHS